MPNVAFVRCGCCDAYQELFRAPSLDGVTDAELAREAKQRYGWTVIGHFGAKYTRCPRCRRSKRYWQVPGRGVVHVRVRCPMLVKKNGRNRRTKLFRREVTSKEARGLPRCKVCS